jgi:hypothetical protein
MQNTFYNRSGSPIAYTSDDTHIFLFNGKPVAYFQDSSIYSYSGKHLGWFENGWVRDHSGSCVFFTQDASGSGPIKPIKGIKPVKGVKGIKPIKGIKEIKPIKPIKSSSWSQLSGQQFFSQ